ncbi:MAG: phosphatase PAP2 family protein, partial [Acidobacteriota bacterium]|nr:phosphatase PAP2 family protein [Acidobacteriota bacterium]
MKDKRQARSFLGLYLVAGLLVLIAMTLTLGEIAEDVRNGEPLTLADVQLSNWLHTHGSAPLTTSMMVVTYLGSTVVVSCLAVLFGLYLLWRRQPYWLTVMVLSVFGGMGVNKLLKFVVHRARPHFNDPILSLTSYSFPSGHTMMATVLYGVLAAFLISKTPRWSWRVLIVAVAGCLILLVGFSRIYLGAHYLSDVLAALAEGLAWLSLCLTAVY